MYPTHRIVQGWIRGYVRAWETNAPEDIAALFTEDAEYRTAPHREPWHGRERIVEGWRQRGDHEGEWAFDWEVLAIGSGLMQA